MPSPIKMRTDYSREGGANRAFTQTLHPASHVGVPRRNPDPDAGRDGNHDCAITCRTRISAAVSTSAHTMTRSPLASTISICPVDP